MIRSSIRKELLQLLADRGALASMFLMPLAFVAFFGMVFRGGGDAGGEGAGRPIAVWHADGHAAGEAIADTLSASGQFAPAAADSAEQVRARVAAEQVRVGLIVPPDFDPAAGRPAELVIDEAASMQFRGPIEGALTALVLRATLEPEVASAFSRPVLAARSPPGIRKPMENVDSFQVTVPGNALLFSFFLAVTVAIGFVEERRRGTFRRLMAAPVRRSTVLLAKLVPYYLVGLVQMAFLFGVGVFVFDMRVGGSVLALCVISGVAVFCAVALGLLVASFGGSEKKVAGFSSLAVLVMGLLGGAMVPRMMMPEAVQQLGLLVPHGWALDAYYDVLIRDGTTLADVAVPIAALAGFGAVFAAIGAARFRFE